MSDAWMKVRDAVCRLNNHYRQMSIARTETREKELGPIIKIATLPGALGDRGLTQLIGGRTGILGVYNWKFRWGRDKFHRTGLFGVALERKTDGRFTIRAVVSHLPFDQELVGKDIPLEEDLEKGVRLKRLDGLEPKTYSSLKMMEVLFQLRLKQEKEAF